MLVNNTQEVMVYRLVTGDEVICQVTKREGTNVIVRNALMMYLEPYQEVVTNPDGTPALDAGGAPLLREGSRIVYVPFMMAGDSDGEIRLSNAHIVAAAKPSAAALKKYQTTTKGL